MSTTTKRNTAQEIADARARIQEMLQKSKPVNTPGSTSSTKQSTEDRITAAKAKLAAKGAVFERNVQALAKAEEDAKQARGGLSVNVHPSLLADLPTSIDRRNRGQVAPKFSTTLANLNRQTEVEARQIQNREKEKEKEKKMEIYTKPLETDFSIDNNPYFDAKLDAAYSVQKDRKARPIAFNPHGKFIEKANAERQAAKMEELKRKIEERARKAGLEEDLDVGDREVLLRPEPPEIEWWDEDFLTNKSYDDIERGELKLDGEETKITLYIQHPIPIPPPSITHAPPARPVMMTAKEMEKSRRIRRAEEQKDKQGKRLLGLLPPEPPKIKMSNLMKVLTSEAVKDPTAVERRVRKEIETRKNKHEQDNEARKLTKEEKHAKESEKRAADVLRTGLHCCLFRIANLSNGSHRYKVSMTAQQLELTGIIILNPRTNIVIVEGGMPAIKKYKRLMMVRINWTDSSRNPTIAKGNQEMLGDQPEPEDLSGNTCELVWEGELRSRNFKKWIGEREASNDAAARKWLGKPAENFWRLAVRSEQA
jgi:U4/U6 small nuclear ribonucleoprotein PRP3